MNKSLVLLLTFIPLITLCQTSDTARAKRISIGIVFSPDYCYRTLKPDNSEISKSIVNYRDSLEIPNYGFTTGLSALFQLNKNFALETGLQYSDKGEKTKSYTEFFYSFAGGGPDSAKASSVYHYDYLDVPLKANYYFFKKRLKMFLSGGLSANFYLAERVFTTIEYDN